MTTSSNHLQSCQNDKDMNDIVDVRDSEDLFINKDAIDVTVETSVDEKEKTNKTTTTMRMTKKKTESPLGLPCRLFFLSFFFFLFAAYRWSICATSTVYLKKHSLIDSCLAMLSLLYEPNMRVQGLIYMYTDDAVCCPFDYLSMRNPISIRTVCVCLRGSLKETKTNRENCLKNSPIVITHSNDGIDVE